MLTKTKAVFLMFALVFTLPLSAAAGTINVSGSLIFPVPQGGAVHLVGDRGFSLSAQTDQFGLSGGPFIGCGCVPGTPIPSGISIVGGGFRGGSAALDGNTYSGIGALGPFFPNLLLAFGGDPFITPPLNVASVVTLTNPVTFSGVFSYPIGILQQPPEPPFVGIETLIGGAATATVVLKHSDLGQSWFVASAAYDIQPPDLQPTPEPATLLLWGTGAAGLGLVRWLRRGRQHSTLWAVFLILAVTLMLSAPPAGAGTIGVRGLMTATSEFQVSLHLEGARGFTLDAHSTDPANIGPFQQGSAFPGMPISLNVSDADLGGGVTLDGVGYNLGSSIPCGASPFPCATIFVGITGEPVIAPPLNVGSLVTVANPVRLTASLGTFSLITGSSSDTLEAVGLGTVTLQRFQFPDQPGFWDITRVTYDLQPTPEPASLLLVGTSAAGLALARWRRRKRAHAA